MCRYIQIYISIYRGRLIQVYLYRIASLYIYRFIQIYIDRLVSIYLGRLVAIYIDLFKSRCIDRFISIYLDLFISIYIDIPRSIYIEIYLCLDLLYRYILINFLSIYIENIQIKAYRCVLINQIDFYRCIYEPVKTYLCVSVVDNYRYVSSADILCISRISNSTGPNVYAIYYSFTMTTHILKCLA